MRVSLRCVCLAMCVATAIEAQINTASIHGAHSRSVESSRFGFGVALQRPVAQQELGPDVGSGKGASAWFSYDLDDAGNIALRAEMGAFILQNGSSDLLLPRYNREFFTRTTVLTSSNASYVGAGVQLSQRFGVLRPNITFAYNRVKFETESFVSGFQRQQGTVFRASNANVGYALALGAGVEIALDARGLAALDIGARYMFGGKGTWLHKGDIEPKGSDSFELNPSSGSIEFGSLALGLRLDVVRILQR